MEEAELRQGICRLEGISSPPASLDRFLELAADCESDIQELTRAIESDPAITSRVLRLSNSAYFGVAGGVGPGRPRPIGFPGRSALSSILAETEIR